MSCWQDRIQDALLHSQSPGHCVSCSVCAGWRRGSAGGPGSGSDGAAADVPRGAAGGRARPRAAHAPLPHRLRHRSASRKSQFSRLTLSAVQSATMLPHRKQDCSSSESTSDLSCALVGRADSTQRRRQPGNCCGANQQLSHQCQRCAPERCCPDREPRRHIQRQRPL